MIPHWNVIYVESLRQQPERSVRNHRPVMSATTPQTLVTIAN
jgi:hypothetical protein